MTGRATSLLEQLPPIRRTRGFRLYAANGIRYLSLWSDYGRALLGFKPEGLQRIAKSTIDRGLLSNLPSQWQKRLAEMVKNLFPSVRSVRIVSSQQGAIAIAKRFAGLPEREPVPDMVFCRFVWDEYLPRNSVPAIMSLILPVPASFSLGILVSDIESGLEEVPQGPEDACIDGLRSAVNLHVLSRLVSCGKAAKERSRIEEAWERFDTLAGNSLFERCGPWLFPKYPRDLHERVFSACLSRRILISPDYDFPSSVPAVFDEGEIAPLRDISALMDMPLRPDA